MHTSQPGHVPHTTCIALDGMDGATSSATGALLMGGGVIVIGLCDVFLLHQLSLDSRAKNSLLRWCKRVN